jgi:hypothetical protein
MTRGGDQNLRGISPEVTSPEVTGRGDRLARFLTCAAARAFVFGGVEGQDCLMWLADWIVARRGFDPAADWRGRYSTARGAARILSRRGGMIRHLDLCLTPHGIGRADMPRRGDIAVVREAEGTIGAIMIDRRLCCAVRDGGLVFRRRPILAAWRI